MKQIFPFTFLLFIAFSGIERCVAQCNFTVQSVHTSPAEVCVGDSSQIITDVSPALGTYTYSWSPTTGLSDPTSPVPMASPTTTTTYTVSVTDTNNCTLTGSVTVVILTSLAQPISITIEGKNALCPREYSLLTVTNYDSTYHFLWSTGETTQTITAAAGNYNVTVTSSNGNCSATDSVALLALPVPTATVTASGSTTFCAGAGSVTLTLNTQPAHSSWLWSSGPFSVWADTAPSITVGFSGQYKVTVQNAYGCSAVSAPVTVNARAAKVSITPSGNINLDEGQTLGLIATSGLTAYQWRLNGSSISGATSDTLAANQPGVYNVLVTDSSGCSGAADAVFSNGTAILSFFADGDSAVQYVKKSGDTLSGNVIFRDNANILNADGSAAMRFNFGGTSALAGMSNNNFVYDLNNGITHGQVIAMLSDSASQHLNAGGQPLIAMIDADTAGSILVGTGGGSRQFVRMSGQDKTVQISNSRDATGTDGDALTMDGTTNPSVWKAPLGLNVKGGNVGIGVDTATAMLDVGGNVNVKDTLKAGAMKVDTISTNAVITNRIIPSEADTFVYIGNNTIGIYPGRCPQQPAQTRDGRFIGQVTAPVPAEIITDVGSLIIGGGTFLGASCIGFPSLQNIKVGIGINPTATLDVNGNCHFSGNVGIGTTTPSDQLHIKGAATIHLENTDGTNTLLQSAGGVARLISNKAVAVFLNSTNDAADADTYFLIAKNQNYFGSNLVPLFKVNSDGVASARKIRTTLGAFPDYVFEEKYPLMSITELEKYIKANKHLPNIMTAEEAKKSVDGVDIGDMQVKLLQKVEELTLYMIETNKKVDALQKENEQLKAEIKAIKK